MTSFPPPFEDRTPSPDDEHLRILSICHYVLAGLSAVGCCGYGIFSIVMSSAVETMMTNVPQPAAGPPFPAEAVGFFGAFYVVFGVVQIAIGIAYGIGYVLAARALAARRNLTLCYIVAGCACVSIPFGTALGVFTFIVLSRPSVQAQFEARRRADLHGVRR